MSTPKKQTGWDLKKFEGMTGPMRIRVERYDRRSGKSEPIPLPQQEWSKEDAARIEQIVLNDVAGGGTYKGQIIDQTGSTMEWEFHYSPEFFPAKLPPMSAGAAAPMPTVVHTPAGPASLGWQPGLYGTPVAPPMPAAVQAYQPPPQYQQPYMNPVQAAPPYMYGGYGNGYGGWPASTPREPDKALQREVEQLRIANVTTEHRRERESAELQHRQELANMQLAFKEEMRAMRESLAAPRRDDAETSAMNALRLQLDEMKRQSETQIAELRRQNEAQVAELRRQNDQLAAERAREAAEARHREELRMMQENSQRQIDALKDLIAKSTENRVDPQMQMLVEIQRQQAEAQRESTRLSSENTREMARVAADQPRTMIEMVERIKAASGDDRLLANIANAYSGAWEMQSKVMEMVMNQNPSPGMALAEGALQAGKETLERFIGAKRDQEIAKARVEQARAQERATTAAATAAAYQQQNWGRSPDGSYPMPPIPREQLAGAPAPEVPPAVVDAAKAATAKAESAEKAVKSKVPAEATIFGPIYDDVKKLRAEVAAGRIPPDQVAAIVLQAADELEKQNVVVPVFTLFSEKRYAELMDHLLPGVPAEFVGDCVSALVKFVREVSLDDDADDDDDPGDNGVGGADPDQAGSNIIDVPVASA